MRCGKTSPRSPQVAPHIAAARVRSCPRCLSCRRVFLDTACVGTRGGGVVSGPETAATRPETTATRSCLRVMHTTLLRHPMLCHATPCHTMPSDSTPHVPHTTAPSAPAPATHQHRESSQREVGDQHVHELVRVSVCDRLSRCTQLTQEGLRGVGTKSVEHTFQQTPSAWHVANLRASGCWPTPGRL